MWSVKLLLLYREEKLNLSTHLDLYQSSTMYQFFIIILLHLLSCTGASESGIVGGNVAKPHSRPYMVSLQHRKHHVCGGMLIHKSFVLTAAHCLKDAYPLKVVLGAHNLMKEEKKCWQESQVVHYHTHPLHQNITQFDYDIMILKLKTPARLSKCVNVIGLADNEKHAKKGLSCSVAGWGKTESTNTLASNVLMETEVTVEDNSKCKSVWQKYFEDKQMMCTNTNAGKGFCQGDSGGPLICKNKAQGVIAFQYAADCADHRYPQVYTKIPFFRLWIKEVLDGYGANLSLS
ncbi:chymase 1, mast cell [Esox lucius]|uniref:Chymase n=1 Tax=Esox lucius TaxID=8010 RepID=C1BWT8_ESOLU|nr:chymase 1, mast cell [Esox lucius]ACO13491.1 Chymase precursor [Esox lucius]